MNGRAAVGDRVLLWRRVVGWVAVQGATVETYKEVNGSRLGLHGSTLVTSRAWTFAWEWTESQIEQLGPPVATGDGLTEKVTVRVSAPIGGVPRKSLRLRVGLWP